MSSAPTPRTATESDLEEALETELAFRRRRQEALGGSDVPAILGFNSYRDALDVYHRKTRPVDPEEVRDELEERSIDVWRGHRNEPDAVRLFLDEHGYDGRHESRQIRSDAHRHLRVHVDGTIFADPDRDPPRDSTGVVEVKSPRAGVFADYIDQGVPRRFAVQADFNSAVSGRPWSAIVLFCDHHDAGPIVSIQRDLDPEFGELLLERAAEFWDRHVEPRIPPDPAEWDMSDSEEAEEVLRDRGGEYAEVEDAPILEQLAEAYRLHREAEERYESLREDAQSWIEEHLETDAVQTPDGDKVRVIRQEGRTYFDRDALRDHRPIDRDAFHRALREGVLQVDREQTETGTVAEVLRRLELDLDRFEREGSPSSHIRVYPTNE